MGLNAKKVLLALSTISCCPYCGARLELEDGHCSACGSKIDREFLWRLAISKYGGADAIGKNSFLSAVDLVAAKMLWAKSRLRDYLAGVLREKFKAEGRDLKDIQAELVRLENEISERLEIIQKLQERAIVEGSLRSIEEAFNEMNSFLKKYKDLIDPTVLAMYIMPEYALTVGNHLYKAMRIGEAIEWFSMAISSILYPTSSPTGSPSMVLSAYMPLGISLIGGSDFDFDGTVEVFMVPGSDVKGVDVPCIIINRLGKVFAPLKGYEALLPIFGDFGAWSSIVIAWKRRNMLDASILSEGREIRIKMGTDTYYSLPAYNVWVEDVNGDGREEILLAATKGRLYMLVPSGDHFEANTFFVGNIVDLAVDKNSKSGYILTLDGRLLKLSFDTRNLELVDRNIEGASSSTISVGDMDRDGKMEIYIASDKGLYRYVPSPDGDYNKARIVEGDVLGSSVIDVNNDGKYELVVVRNESSVVLEIYKLVSFLGGSAFELDQRFLVSRTPINRAVFNIREPFVSRPIFFVGDIDGDGAQEYLIGADKKVLVLDLRYD